MANYKKYLSEMGEEDLVKKEILLDYKNMQKEADKLMTAIKKKLGAHAKRFMMGRGPDMSYMNNMKEIIANLKNVDGSIRY